MLRRAYEPTDCRQKRVFPTEQEASKRRLGPNLVEYEPGLVHLTYLSRIA
jgi:hypothetical protein